MSNQGDGIAPELRVQAETISYGTMYKFREDLVGATPSLKLLAAKSLLGKVRTMVEDLEESVNKPEG